MDKNFEISPDGKLLVYKDGYSIEFMRDTINSHGLDGLRVFSVLRNQKVKDLHFLSDLTFLRTLDITGKFDEDLSFLKKLKELRKLTLNIWGNFSIDLSHQINLEILIISWGSGIVNGLNKCKNLVKILIDEFNDPNLIFFGSLEKLEEIKISSSAIETLDGIDRLSRLKEISIVNCKNLQSIGSLNNIKSITSITIDRCSNIKDYENLKSLPNLANLEINDCGDLASIEFVQNLTSLRRLVFIGTTNIVTGNIKPAEKIPEVIYNHRIHYNVRIKNENYETLVKKNLDKIKNMFKN